MVVREKKGFYDKFDTETKLPTNLQMQIWDNDAISADDFLGKLKIEFLQATTEETAFHFLGSLTINISNIPSPAKTSKTCELKQQRNEFINLFEVEKVRGWFPAKGLLKDGKMGRTVRI